MAATVPGLEEVAARLMTEMAPDGAAREVVAAEIWPGVIAFLHEQLG